MSRAKRKARRAARRSKRNTGKEKELTPDETVTDKPDSAPVEQETPSVPEQETPENFELNKVSTRIFIGVILGIILIIIFKGLK